ncbi:MaoC/PaaZ C-terminal domain-containing protein [Alicycliphilus denitrificans]|uniref:3-alpha,7-alpha, 12-alpha-trihydroxy-5-beta-cholest-24-enoyl-CoA hydratase n=1 Tax=Alicycliphilus denitrificans TaxID=179636 RepID=A0A3R7ITK8_9BURK|nr:MaoC/PaaZ C-terminal domain-containing protein [Alicycliphilus denitrificans]RKJ97115.1 3-alpha,7-alpha,12-alpha-trihydroxy-5-beta-cholest-24-enoyl-CoA hydratase [Alicycliphilus denitrificans]
MSLDYQKLKAASLPTIEEKVEVDKCILYALGVGAGLGDAEQVGYEVALVFEERLEVLPAMACVVGYVGFWMRDPQYGLDWKRVVHAEQRMRFFGVLEPGAKTLGTTRVKSIGDKGVDKGAVVVIERQLRDASGQLLCEMEQVNFCRGDGGYAKGNPKLSDALPEAIAKPPPRAADAAISLPSSRNQAAIYRLTGDRNPLHVDPAAAQAAGFTQPIMHGAASLGMVNRALRLAGNPGRSAALASLAIRFTGVFFQGETMLVEIWRSGPAASFRCSVPGRSQEIAYGCATWEEER